MSHDNTGVDCEGEGRLAMPRYRSGGQKCATDHALRSVGKGEHMILDDNFFVETILPGGIIRKLSEEEMTAYRAPFLEREARLPTLVWPRQIPIEGEPADVTAIVETYGKWLSQSRLPKLLVLSDPGVIMTGRMREFCRTWPNQREVTVRGKHFLQEDSPDQIGMAIASSSGSCSGCAARLIRKRWLGSNIS